jgi:hypothetical protein
VAAPARRNDCVNPSEISAEEMVDDIQGRNDQKGKEHKTNKQNSWEAYRFLNNSKQVAENSTFEVCIG